MSEYIISVSDANKKRADDLRCILHTTVGIYEHTEQIVRCRDCKWSRIADGSSWPANKHKQYIGKTYCIKWGDGYAGEWVKPDGYCAWGERRDSE